MRRSVVKPLAVAEHEPNYPGPRRRVHAEAWEPYICQWILAEGPRLRGRCASSPLLGRFKDLDSRSIGSMYRRWVEATARNTPLRGWPKGKHVWRNAK